MAVGQEGWNLKANVDISSFLQANQQAEKLLGTLRQVDAGLGKMKPNDALAKSIKSADIASASLAQRLSAEGKAYESDKVKAEMYANQVTRLKDRQAGLVRELDKISKSSDKASDAYNIQKARIEQTKTAIIGFENKLKSTRSEMERIKPSSAWGKTVKYSNQVAKAGDTIKSKMHSAWDSVKSGALVGGAAIGAAGAAAMHGAKIAGELQQRYREINNLAVLGGEKQREVTKSVAEMQNQARDISIKYGKSQTEIAEGYEDLVKRGYTTKQALGAMRAEIQASVASGDKFSDVTTVSSQVLDAFGMRSNKTKVMLANTKKVVNELAYSADATSTGFSDLGVAMSYVGTAAKSNNISLAETASALGVLSNNGLESDKAGTALRGTINGITGAIKKIGGKGDVLTPLGLGKKDLLDKSGNLKDLSTVMGTLYKHIEEHTKGGAERNNIFRSIFGTSAMNGALILAKSSDELEKLTKRTEAAGKSGDYVAKLAQKNMGTYQGNAARAKQAMQDFQIAVGTRMLPAMTEAQNELSKFLLSKDGKEFEKNIGGAVSNVTKALIDFIKFAEQHKTAMKVIGTSIFAGWSVYKGAQFVKFLGEVQTAYKGLSDSSKSLQGLNDFAKLQKNPIKNWGKLGKMGRLAVGANVVFDAAQIGGDFYKAVKSAKGSKEQAGNYGSGIGGIIGGVIGASLGGAAGMTIGTELGRQMGKAAGPAFEKAFKAKPKVTVKGVHFQDGKLVQGASKNGIYALDKHGNMRFYDQRNDMEKRFDTGHRLELNSFAHPKNLGDFLGGAASGLWQASTHIADLDWWKRSGVARREMKGSWLDWSGFFNFKPQIHGKKPKHINYKLQKSALIPDIKLPKIDGKKWAKGVQRDIKSGWSGFKSWNGKLGKESSSFFKSKWSGLESWAGKRKRDTQNGWKNTKKWFGNLGQDSSKFFKSKWAGLEKWAGKRQSDVKSGWHGAEKWFGNLGTNLVKMFKKPFEGLGSWIHKQWQGALDIVGKVKGGAENLWAKATGKKVKSHAAGGQIIATHGALVGEAGPELAYKAGSHARLLGAHGPEFTKVRAGEHILNARDTARVFSGGLGTGYRLKGYANGTDKLGKASNNAVKDYKQLHDKSSKSIKDLSKTNESAWKKISSTTTKQATNARKKAVKEYQQTHKGVINQVSEMKSGVVSLGNATSKGFGKSLNHMKKYANSAMGDTVGVLNKGIRSIDSVLGQFGGNSAVIKPIHFATGTDSNGRLTRDTFAMVNDATIGPKQEALVSPDNRLYFPRGENVRMMLPKGWGVLNGTQTQHVTRGMRHFAKGTGVSHSLLRKIAENAEKSPSKWFADKFSDGIKGHGSEINRGSAKLAKNATTHYGNPWSTAMWNVINNAIGGASGKGGTREAFLKYAESTFNCVPYQMGAATKALSDCSGMVMQALAHFGVNIGRTTVAMQQSSGVQYLGKSLSKTLPGDLVIFGHGTGAAGHVGIIKNPKTGTMFNETPPHARVTDIASDKSMGYGYYRVRGLHNQKPTKAQKTSSSLEGLAKRELGKRALKWISDNLADMDMSGAQAGKATGDHNHWLKQAGVPEKDWAGLSYIIQHESGWNPKAVNPSSGTYGLGQMQSYNLHYYTKHGSKDNPIAQIMGIVDYAKGRYGSIGGAVNYWRVHHNYAKGGTHRTGLPFIAGENGPELITTDKPVHIDSYQQTKRKTGKLASLLDNVPTHRRSVTRAKNNQPITINININGPISSRKDAMETGEIIKAKVGQIIYEILGKELGGDPSEY